MERDNGTDQLHFRYVGLKELSRIELPSFESDMASAVRAVGGEQRIAEAIQLQQIPLQYNLTEGCIPSSVINATPVNKNGFLVRIRRERANPTNTTCELLGAVPKSYVFNALADYKVNVASTIVFILILTIDHPRSLVRGQLTGAIHAIRSEYTALDDLQRIGQQGCAAAHPAREREAQHSH